MSRFVDKVVIVTGSSAGIGKAVILGFAKEGANVVLHGTNTERLAEAEKSLHDAGIPESRILKVQGELNQVATHDRIINDTVARFGKIDVLVNNAGSFRKPGDTATDIENFDYVFAVNVRAVFRLVELAISKRRRGTLLMFQALPECIELGMAATVYGMTKAALDRYTQNINQSLMKKGIRINNINPGPFESNFRNRAVAEATDEERAAAQEHRSKSLSVVTPAGRCGEPEELVPAFLLLADEKSSFITGSLWVIDGGMGTWAPEPSNLKL
uniref:SDR family oxidoreductase n=1 Tax=Panagrellus redivivus TaxID=6233 RepID=A0A7E4V0I4_PANRE